MNALSLFVTCARGTETALLRECERLGISVTEAPAGGRVSASPRDAYRLCLWSRVASRVIHTLGDAVVDAADDLYEAARSIPWEEHFVSSQRFAITAFGRHPAFSNDRFAVQRMKDAIVDRFRDLGEPRPNVDRDDPDVRLTVFLGQPCEFGMELSSAMHRRSYRSRSAVAPLRESLAAAMIELSGWDETTPLVDPCCGSGTLLLEAALRYCRIAPGLLRGKQGFMAWRQYDEACHRALVQEAERARRAPGDMVLFGSDISRDAIRHTREAARRLGIDAALDTRVVPIERAPVPARQGWLVTNPPYGLRVGEERELIPFYERLGNTLKQRFAGYQAWLLLGNPELAKHLGLRAAQRLTLFNGAIECRFAHYPLYEGSKRSADAAASPEAAPGKHTLSDADSPGGAPARDSREAPETPAPRPLLRPETHMFANRLRKNRKRLEPWALRENVSAYRIYDADIPEFNLVVDRYGERVRVEEYAPPRQVARHVADQRLRDALHVVAGELGVALEDIVLRVRARRTDRDAGPSAPRDGARSRIVVQEGSMYFEVDLEHYLDTGLFLEDRPLRRYVGKHVGDKRFLNLFAYTCTASVAAALGGAERTVSVDTSHTYLNWGKANFRRNQIDLAKHAFVESDAITWLGHTAKLAQKFDVVYCGPPTHSHSRRQTRGRKDFEVVSDQRELIEGVLSVLSPDGFLLFFVHAKGFTLEAPKPCKVENLSKKLTARDTPASSLQIFKISKG